MNTARVISAAKQIERCRIALQWLEEFGGRMTVCGEGATVSVRVNYAGACNGAKEAEEMLSRYAQLELPSLVDAAIRNCRNTIEISEQIIREECTPTKPGEAQG